MSKVSQGWWCMVEVGRETGAGDDAHPGSAHGTVTRGKRDLWLGVCQCFDACFSEPIGQNLAKIMRSADFFRIRSEHG